MQVHRHPCTEQRQSTCWFGGRSLHLLLSLTLGMGASGLARSATAMEPARVEPSARARDLNHEGQRRYDAGDYLGAAQSWARILEVLPENDVNREERDNALLITLEASRSAYEKRINAPGDSAREDGIDYLRSAISILERYEAEFDRAYGGTQSISPDARRLGDEIRELLAEAEARLGPSRETPPPRIVPTTDDFTPVADFRRGPSGTGLIVAGAVTMTAGLAMTSMIVVGAVRARQAREDIEDAREDMPPDEDAERDAERRLDQGNALMISGGVLTGVFLAGGATMLGIGIRRRVRYMAVAPSVGPRYVGISATARF